MERSSDLTDSSDWLNTSVAPLSAVETSLRCQVCKDFFNTPMITSCSHTFCSLCIRRCLNNDGKCPACRAADQVGKLRKNGIVEEITTSFLRARPSVIRLGREAEEAKNPMNLARKSSSPQGIKRKAREAELDFEQPLRRTRSQNRRVPDENETSSNPVAVADKPIIVESLPDDRLVPCPICQERMKQETVFLHLDIHQDPEPVVSWHQPRQTNIADKSARPMKVPDRLPSLNYSILTDSALRKKFKEIGIPATGSRSLLIARHKEWIDLVNANCDSSRPRSKRDLLSELDVWERTQGGLAPSQSGVTSGGGEVMRKDFDSSAWASTHKDGFQDLIARARQKPKSKHEDSQHQEKEQEERNLEPPSIRIPSPINQIDGPRSNPIRLPAEIPLDRIRASTSKNS